MEPGSRRIDRNRKYASKNTTRAGIARYTNCSAVCTYDTRRRGKSKPATNEFRCEERIKNPRPNCIFDTASCIGDPQENVYAGRAGRSNGGTGASVLRSNDLGSRANSDDARCITDGLQRIEI